MANAFLNVCRFTPTAGGTTDWTYSAAVTGYQSPAASGVVNSTVYAYRAESADLSQWEVGFGAYNTGTGVLARTTVLYNSSGTGTATGQTGAGSKINFTAVPQVAIVALAADIANLGKANDFTDTTEATGAGTTAAQIIRGGLEVLKKLFVTGIAKFTDATAASSTTTGAVVITGGIGVGDSGWFGGLLRTAGGFVSTVAPASAPAVDFSQATALTVAASLASNTVLAPSAASTGLLIVADTTHGYGAVYLANGGTLTAILLTGPWVSTTTTPAADRVSIAWNGSAYALYNNYVVSILVKVGYIKIA